MTPLLESLRLLADETRLRLLLLLREEELSVAELQEILGMGQSRISAHLAQLRSAELLRDRRAGKHVYYAANDGARVELTALLDAAAQELTPTAADRRALHLLLQKRQDRAREYFNALAGKFGRSYCPGRTWEGVAHLLFALLPEDLVVADLGAGEGTLAQLLARRVRKVIAVDNSEKMVEFGTRLASEHGFKNLEYRLGDLENPPLEPGSVDFVLLSQALHHAQHPARTVAAAHRALRPGGRVAVLDLLAHQFEQARELYADEWLGFTEAQLYDWLETAGFQRIEIAPVSRDEKNPQFQVILALGTK